MKIIIASDSFKGSNSSIRVAEAIERGIKKVSGDIEIVKTAVADGGEGLVSALVPDKSKWIMKRVTGPMNKPVEAHYVLLGSNTAVIEMASSSGLTLVEEEANPLLATTYGTGELMKDALEKGCTTIYLGIGGSATNDGGTGMASALGARFLDKENQRLEPVGGNLDRISRIDLSHMPPELRKAKIRVACDVDNPLCGKRGASAVYGPQKGATPEMVGLLDANLNHLAVTMERESGKNYGEIPGAGAAGGLGYGLRAFCGARLESGIDLVLGSLDFDRLLEGTSLIITGEGRIDGQSAHGKVPVGIASRAKKKNIPVLAICGDIGPGADSLYDFGIDSVMCTVNRAMPLNEAMDRSTELLEDAAERAFRMIGIGRKIKR